MAEPIPPITPPESAKESPGRIRRMLRIAGPGLITGGADNDPAGIATYSVVGATTGLTQLWLLVISVPLLIAVQGIAARLGTVTKRGLAELIPPISPNITYVSGAVGLLGTTITPYLFFWQAGAEREARRGVEQLRESYLDLSSGMVFSNVIAYFIVISTASSLFIHHRSIQTAADAAAALTPFAGPFASVLFSVGILGAGLLAIPVLATSTGYIVAGTFGWKVGLGHEAHAAPGFYAVVALSFLAGVELAISGVNPIKALFYSQILDGLVAPILIALMVVLVSRRSLMGLYVATVWERVGGWAAFTVMTIADVALIYGLASGHG